MTEDVVEAAKGFLFPKNKLSSSVHSCITDIFKILQIEKGIIMVCSLNTMFLFSSVMERLVLGVVRGLERFVSLVGAIYCSMR